MKIASTYTMLTFVASIIHCLSRRPLSFLSSARCKFMRESGFYGRRKRQKRAKMEKTKTKTLFDFAKRKAEERYLYHKFSSALQMNQFPLNEDGEIRSSSIQSIHFPTPRPARFETLERITLPITDPHHYHH